MKRKFRKDTWAAVIILGLGILVSVLIVRRGRNQEERTDAKVSVPMVEVAHVQARPWPIDILGYGTVRSVHEVQLASQTSGRIVWINENLRPGGTVRKEEVLVKIDPQDFELAVEQAEAQVAQARYQLELARAQKDVADTEITLLRQALPESSVLDQDLSPLARRLPQMKQAQANLKAAQANLKQAHLMLDRTVIRAPFEARVLDLAVGPGQFITAASPIARLRQTAPLEVEVAIPFSKIVWIAVPHRLTASAETDGAEDEGSNIGSAVVLVKEVQGGSLIWKGRVVRILGQLEGQSQFASVIVEVEHIRASNGVELPTGLVVEASIEGQTLDKAIVIPKTAIRENNVVWTLDHENRLRFQDVELQVEMPNDVVIESGLHVNDRIVLSNLPNALPGMKVRPRLREEVAR